jgi:hypothetical protein
MFRKPISESDNLRDSTKIVEFYEKGLKEVIETWKWSFGILIATVTFLMAFLGILNLKYSDDLSKKIDERLGKIEAIPNLKLLNIDGRDLEGTDITVTRIIARNGAGENDKLPYTETTYYFPLTFDNTSSKGSTNYLLLKISTNDFKVLASKSKGYKYEKYMTVKSPPAEPEAYHC